MTVTTALSIIASAVPILPASEAIGQLKWTWFHGKKSKDAYDFEILDKASRGAWDSIMLLYRTKGQSLAALGALFTILLLAIATFFQQFLDLPEHWSIHGQSSISCTVQYSPIVEWACDSITGGITLARSMLIFGRRCCRSCRQERNTPDHER